MPALMSCASCAKERATGAGAVMPGLMTGNDAVQSPKVVSLHLEQDT